MNPDSTKVTSKTKKSFIHSKICLGDFFQTQKNLSLNVD